MKGYNFRARTTLTILTSLPMLVLFYAILSTYHNALNEIFLILPWLTYLGITGASIYLLTQINRFVSKEIFQKLLFQDELKMPTTTQLLWSDKTLAKIFKERIREKIRNDFQIDLMSLDDERKNEVEARKLIVSAISQVRNALRRNTLLLQHNTEYGFVRNMAGGSLIALISSAFLVVYGCCTDRNSLWNIGMIFLVVYLGAIVMCVITIPRYGNYYAKILFEQYISEDVPFTKSNNLHDR